MAETYTIADLCALPDGALDALAAELRGWHWIESDLVDESGKVQVMWPVCFTPTTDRNQSGELLIYAQQQGARFKQVVADDGILEININARAETIAFCAAMLAMAGRLKGGQVR